MVGEAQKKINKILYYILITQYKWRLNKSKEKVGAPEQYMETPIPLPLKIHTLINKYPSPETQNSQPQNSPG